MGAHDRPFPPGGLPPEASRIFKRAFELAYHRQYLVKDSAVDGQGTQLAVRKFGQFEIHVEFQIALPKNLIRYVVTIWYARRLVFNAWSSIVAGSGETVGVIVTCEDGPWKAHLRRRVENAGSS